MGDPVSLTDILKSGEMENRNMSAQGKSLSQGQNLVAVVQEIRGIAINLLKTGFA